MPGEACTHIEAITTVRPARRHECEECVKMGARWVHLLYVPAMRRHALLRQLTQPSREQARTRNRASGDRLRGTW